MSLIYNLMLSRITILHPYHSNPPLSPSQIQPARTIPPPPPQYHASSLGAARPSPNRVFFSFFSFYFSRNPILFSSFQSPFFSPPFLFFSPFLLLNFSPHTYFFYCLRCMQQVCYFANIFQ